MPDPDRKKVRIGQKISSDKIKQKEHETSGQRDAEHARGAASLELEANMKASIPLTYLVSKLGPSVFKRWCILKLLFKIRTTMKLTLTPQSHASSCFNQEDADAALKKLSDGGGEDETVAEQEPNQESGDSDSSDENFGFKKQKETPAACKPKGQKRQSVVGDRDPSSRPVKPRTKAEGEEDEEKGSRHLARGHGLLQALEGFQPAAFWQGSLKTAEWEGRIGKALQASSDLAAFFTDEASEGKVLSNKLTAMAEDISKQMDFLASLRNSKAADLQNISEEQVSMLASLPSNCILLMLGDFSRAMLEDPEVSTCIHLSC